MCLCLVQFEEPLDFREPCVACEALLGRLQHRELQKNPRLLPGEIVGVDLIVGRRIDAVLIQDRIPRGVDDRHPAVGQFGQARALFPEDAAEGWWPGTPSGKGEILWTRTTRIHAFSISALDQDTKDFTLSESERLIGASDTSDLGNQNIKEVEVVLESEKDSSVFGGSKRTTFRMLKIF